MKILFICNKGLDTFIHPVVEQLKDNYDTEVFLFQNPSQSDELTQKIYRADVVWLEWANELTASITKQFAIGLKDKKVIVRCHSYEVLVPLAINVNYEIVNDVIFIAEHVRDTLLEQVTIPVTCNTHVIPNFIDVEKFPCGNREEDADINIAMVGHLSEKKGMQLLLHAFNYFYYNVDWQGNDIVLHIAGEWQDLRLKKYYEHMIKESGLEGVVIFHGWQNDIVKFHRDNKISHIICCSPWESQNMSVLEAMSMGIKPLIHNFVGAENIYDSVDFECLWISNDDVQYLIDDYNYPREYRQFVKDKFSPEIIVPKLKEVIDASIVIPECTCHNHDVSCVIATKNGAKSIAKAIKSVCEQSYPVKKIVVVDDNSDQENKKKIDEIAEEISKIKGDTDIDLLRLGTTNWVPRARNAGAFKVDTDYIFFLDDDDVIDKTYIEKAVNEFKADPALTVVYSDITYLPEFKTAQTPEYDYNKLLGHNYIMYSALMKTEEFKQIDGYDNYMSDCRNHCYDQYLWLKILEGNRKAKRIPECLFYYNQSETGRDHVSKNYERQRTDMDVQMMLEHTKFQEGTRIEFDYKGEAKKRIMLVCFGRDYMNHDLFSWEAYTFIKPLEEFGEVFTFFWDIEEKYLGKEQMLQKLMKYADLIKPDLIFHVCYKEEAIPMHVWSEISKKHKTVGFFCDDNWRFDSFSKEYSEGFSHVITTYSEYVEKYRHYHIQSAYDYYKDTHYMQWAANTHYFKPDPNVKKDIDVIFFGQIYGNRKEHLDHMTNSFPDLNIQIYGHGTENGMVDFPEMIKLMQRSKIAINFTKGANGEDQIKCRPFEIITTGCILVTEVNKQFDELIPTIGYYSFHTPEGLVACIETVFKYYNNHVVDKCRTETEVNNNHTWTKRFEEFFKSIL